jgi:acyl carrier protein
MKATISTKMHTSVELKEILRNFIADTTFTPLQQIQDDTLIFVQGIFDSMGFISLINFLEEEFSINAEDSELLEENFESVNAITGFIERKLKLQA